MKVNRVASRINVLYKKEYKIKYNPQKIHLI
jgi:hypothetical protein